MPLGASGALIPVDAGARRRTRCRRLPHRFGSIGFSQDKCRFAAVNLDDHRYVLIPHSRPLRLLTSATMLAHVTTAATRPKGGGYRAESPLSARSFTPDAHNAYTGDGLPCRRTSSPGHAPMPCPPPYSDISGLC